MPAPRYRRTRVCERRALGLFISAYTSRPRTPVMSHLRRELGEELMPRIKNSVVLTGGPQETFCVICFSQTCSECIRSINGFSPVLSLQYRKALTISCGERHRSLMRRKRLMKNTRVFHEMSFLPSVASTHSAKVQNG